MNAASVGATTSPPPAAARPWLLFSLVVNGVVSCWFCFRFCSGFGVRLKPFAHEIGDPKSQPFFVDDDILVNIIKIILFFRKFHGRETKESTCASIYAIVAVAVVVTVANAVPWKMMVMVFRGKGRHPSSK